MNLDQLNGIPAGEMVVFHGGRRVGKSTVMEMLKQRQRYLETHNIFYNNLCKEMVMPEQQSSRRQRNESKYKFSRQWFTVDISFLRTPDAAAKLAWCRETFGPEPAQPDAWSRWTHNLYQIKFRDAADYEWYRLRWGS